ncbi:UbiX family flavin prenyltransferase [Cohaesibacter gelatinilyticus]|uniref:Flavin prenyltransferase UbiX n=1 Tax=Cohaesibacter gelatinilyticus TaxID=372072 RepID=A0A285NFX6_9HYPH|nr:UbiX family flavin prenyltransferase [Cohaesibacter gelatinilyticus]SNZ07793.1 4-hydroxy-3-polyprenylbenzoate decarboxylase [Cohaesibacter gelatinilyticus]
MTQIRKIGIVISGASGSILALSALRILADLPNTESHLIVTEGGQRTLELELEPEEVSEIPYLSEKVNEEQDLAASIASGSNALDAMIILPCSIRTLSAIAYGQTDRLSIRAADVMLKERRPLVLAVRESPLHSGHLQSMQQVTQMGGIIAPPVPAYYLKPQTIEEIALQNAARVLNLAGCNVQQQLVRWER